MRKSLFYAWMMLLILVPFMAFSQTRQLTGTVSDERGAPLGGVSVVQKGTTTGIVTNEAGVFNITVTGASPVLVFSYAGRETRELPVTNATTYNLSLNATGSLSEVVVTALGIQRKAKSLTYSQEEVKGAALTAVPETNIMNSLQGKVAGLSRKHQRRHGDDRRRIQAGT